MDKNNTIYFEKIDFLKGFAIFLVVLGHVVQSLYSTPRFPQGVVSHIIYSFHMPLFFFLSGYLAYKKSYLPLNKLLGKKILQLILPYVVWLFLTITFSTKADLALYTLDHAGYWFLLVLFEIFVLFYVFRIFMDKINIHSRLCLFVVEAFLWICLLGVLHLIDKYVITNNSPISVTLSYKLIPLYFPYFIAAYLFRKYNISAALSGYLNNNFISSAFLPAFIICFILLENQIYGMTVWSTLCRWLAITACFITYNKLYIHTYIHTYIHSKFRKNE
jgi:fucose 4-O-acetylase-like acetyltransferase